jgi:hypothetical protein
MVPPFFDPASTQTNEMLSQLQWPLFRLPREFRDETYTLYTYGISGYHHVFDSRGLSQIQIASGEAPSIPLKPTCQHIAQEIRGVGLRSNVTHFYASDHSLVAPFPSNALRFKRLIEYSHATKWRMMIRCAAQCMTPEILK